MPLEELGQLGDTWADELVFVVEIDMRRPPVTNSSRVLPAFPTAPWLCGRVAASDPAVISSGRGAILSDDRLVFDPLRAVNPEPAFWREPAFSQIGVHILLFQNPQPLADGFHIS